jgi:Zinc knuckle
LKIKMAAGNTRSDHMTAPAPFDPNGDPSAVSTRWRRWKRGFDYYLAARDSEMQDAQKRALFLHCAGLEVQDIFDTLSEADRGTTYKHATDCLDAYFKPQLNTVYERHMFRQMGPQVGETTAQFVTRLKQQAQNCDFGDKLEENVRDQVIDKCADQRLTVKFLEKKNLNLKQVLEIARAHESAQRQMRDMSGHSEQNSSEMVCKVKGDTQRQRDLKTPQQTGRKCYRCGREGHFANDKNCPASGKTCAKCQKKGHFASCCKTRVKFVQSHDDDVHVEFDDGMTASVDTENAFSVASKHPESVDLVVGGVQLTAVIDSGASSNILDRQTWEILKKKKIRCTAQKANKDDPKLYAYGQSKPIEIIGRFQAEISVVQAPDNKQACEFVVIEGKGVTLLGKDTAEKLNVLRVGLPREVHACFMTEKPEKKTEYKQLYTGLGKLKNQKIKLHVNKKMKPVIQNARRIPFSLRSKSRRENCRT